MFLGLAGLSYALHFNGLYGQDAHEYLRQSQMLYARWHGLPGAPAGAGDAEIAGGYPLFGLFFQLLGLDAVLALQCVSWLAAAAALGLFELNLQWLSPGTRGASRWIYGGVGLALSPCFLRTGLTVMSDALGLALTLGALLLGLRAIEDQRWRHSLGFAAVAALAVTTRYALVVLLALPALALVLELWRSRRWGVLAGVGLTAALAFLPFWWLKAGAPKSPLEHSLLHDWSSANFFSATFSQVSGTVSYTLPNLAYICFPLMHPGFCLTLPGLLLLAKRTDAGLYTKRLLLISLLAYLFFLGGLSLQNLRYLLPAYAVLLLLLYPAWDRFFAYGLYFFRRLAHALIALTLVCQLAFTVRMLVPVLSRYRLERDVAAALQAELPEHAEVYAFDLDIALQTYLPDMVWHNLWAQRYDAFPDGSYMVFNAQQLQAQWAGRNPMLNWEYANAHFELDTVQHLPEGWTLYRVVKPK